MNKKLILATLFCCTMPFFTACDDDDDDNEEENVITITFENANLAEKGYINNQKYVENGYQFSNVYNEDYDSWYGYAISNQTDKETEGWANQYSVYAGEGANKSANFAIAYLGAEYDENWVATPVYPLFERVDGAAFKPKSAYFALTTYTYLSTRNGDDFAKKFEAGDYYRINVIGTAIDGKETKVTFDAVNIDNNIALTTWKEIDLTQLGSVVKVEISFESTDSGDWGINTPTYIAVDNIAIVED